MPHEISLITTIAAALGLAMVLGFVASRLKMPPLVGYLVAGIVIGPATPGFVADVEPGEPAGRDRRDAVDVRRRLALFTQRLDGSPPYCGTGRHCPDRCGDRARRGDSDVLGSGLRRGAGVRSRSFRREHGRAAARTRRPRRARLDQRAHRRWLAGGRGSGHGVGAGAAAADGGPARRQGGHRSTPAATSGRHWQSRLPRSRLSSR